MDFVPMLTCQVTVRTVSLSIAFMTIHIKFKYCNYEEIILMFSIQKLCFRKRSLVTFSFVSADLRLWVFFLVFILFVTVSLSQLLIGSYMCLSSCVAYSFGRFYLSSSDFRGYVCL